MTDTIPSIDDDDDIDGCLIAAQCAADALDALDDDDYGAIGDQSLSPADRNPSLCR